MFAMRRQASSCSCLPLQLLGARVIGNAKLDYGVVITTNPSLVGSLSTITRRTCGDCEFNVHSATTTVTTSSEVAELVSVQVGVAATGLGPISLFALYSAVVII